MRRSDREMDREFGLGVIDRSSHGVLSVVDGDCNPYSIPLSIVRIGETLYFHSAKEGKKIDILQDGKRVRIVFVGDVAVPDNYTHEELDQLLKDPSKKSLLVRSVFTTEYESAIVTGRISQVESREEKEDVLEAICKNYVPHMEKYIGIGIETGMPRIAVFKIKIEEVTAKRKKYDSNRKEMKWGRMEDANDEIIKR